MNNYIVCCAVFIMAAAVCVFGNTPVSKDLELNLLEPNKTKITEGKIVAFQGSVMGIKAGQNVDVTFTIDKNLKNCTITRLSEDTCGTKTSRCFCTFDADTYDVFFRTMALTEFSERDVIITADVNDGESMAKSNTQKFPRVKASAPGLSEFTSRFVVTASTVLLLTKSILF